MTDKELAVIDVLCGNSKTQWSLCDTSCSGCNFYFEDSDMGAVVPICIHGFGKSRNSCAHYMTHKEYSQLVRSCLANFKAENEKLRELCIDFASMLSYAGLDGLVVEAHIGGTAKTYDVSVLCDMVEKLWDEVDG